MHLLISYSFTGLVTSKWGCGFALTSTNRTRFSKKPLVLWVAPLIQRRLRAPCIVLCNYLFAKWILSTCSPWCCHTSSSLLGEGRWGEWHREKWRGPPRLCQRDADKPITLESLSSSLWSRRYVCLNAGHTLFSFALICCLCWCYCLCILARSSSPSREIGLSYCEHTWRIVFCWPGNSRHSLPFPIILQVAHWSFLTLCWF